MEQIPAYTTSTATKSIDFAQRDAALKTIGARLAEIGDELDRKYFEPKKKSFGWFFSNISTDNDYLSKAIAGFASVKNYVASAVDTATDNIESYFEQKFGEFSTNYTLIPILILSNKYMFIISSLLFIFNIWIFYKRRVAVKQERMQEEIRKLKRVQTIFSLLLIIYYVAMFFLVTLAFELKLSLLILILASAVLFFSGCN